jgi:DNA-binding NtrC family response regulator
MGGSVFVLFVDDDVAFADEAARSLETVGMRTVVALGSLAALDDFDANAIDVIVTDIKLPAGENHGLALARMINKRRPRVPVILMTTYAKLPEGEVALPGGALCNPLELAELCREIATRQAHLARVLPT